MSYGLIESPMSFVGRARDNCKMTIKNTAAGMYLETALRIIESLQNELIAAVCDGRHISPCAVTQERRMTDEEINRIIDEHIPYITMVHSAEPIRNAIRAAVDAERDACAQFVAWQGAALTIKASHESEQGNGYCAENLDEAAKQMKATSAAIRKRGEQ